MSASDDSAHQHVFGQQDVAAFLGEINALAHRMLPDGGTVLPSNAVPTDRSDAAQAWTVRPEGVHSWLRTPAAHDVVGDALAHARAHGITARERDVLDGELRQAGVRRFMFGVGLVTLDFVQSGRELQVLIERIVQPPGHAMDAIVSFDLLSLHQWAFATLPARLYLRAPGIPRPHALVGFASVHLYHRDGRKEVCELAQPTGRQEFARALLQPQRLAALCFIVRQPHGLMINYDWYVQNAAGGSQHPLMSLTLPASHFWHADELVLLMGNHYAAPRAGNLTAYAGPLAATLNRIKGAVLSGLYGPL